MGGLDRSEWVDMLRFRHLLPSYNHYKALNHKKSTRNVLNVYNVASMSQKSCTFAVESALADLRCLTHRTPTWFTNGYIYK